MSNGEAQGCVHGNRHPEVYGLFGIGREEFIERAARGVDSALYRRLIEGEWAATRDGEKELSNRRTSAFNEVHRSVKCPMWQAATIAVAGSYLLENKTPPCIK